MPPEPRTWDDYFIPGTKTLHNFLGLTQPEALARAEVALADRRIAQLLKQPITGTFDYEHVKAIHRHIFQDVYEWAGQERTAPTDGPMSKPAPDIVNHSPGDPAAPLVHYAYYPAGPALTHAAEHRYALLKQDHHLTGLDPHTFTQKLAEHWGELNEIHSFREGNTRTQLVFFHDLAKNAGYQLHLEAFSVGNPLRTEFVNARNYSLATGSNTRLAELLNKTLTPLPERHHTTPHRALIHTIRERAEQQAKTSNTPAHPRTPRHRGQDLER